MKVLLAYFAALLLISPNTIKQSSEFEYIYVESIVAEIEVNGKNSTYYLSDGLFTLICWDDRIREIVTTIDPENKHLETVCMDESNIYQDCMLELDLHINTIQELFSDSEAIEEIKDYFNYVIKADSLEVNNQIWIKDDVEAIFEINREKYYFLFKAKIIEDNVKVIMSGLGVSQMSGE